MIRTLVLSSIAFALAACSASEVVVSGTGSQGLPYDPSYVRYVMGQGDVPLEVHGNPTSLDNQAFVSLVEDRLRLDAGFGNAAFRTKPTMRNAHGFRVVLVFNADNRRMDPRLVCRGEQLDKAGAPNSVLHVRGVFCSREQVLSTNTALVATPTDFGSPLFGRLLDSLMFEMMPAEGNRDVDEGCPPMANC